MCVSEGGVACRQGLAGNCLGISGCVYMCVLVMLQAWSRPGLRALRGHHPVVGPATRKLGPGEMTIS